MKALLLIAALLAGNALAEDSRQLVKLPAPAQEALREEMQGNLVALNEVLALIAVGKIREAGEVAEAKLGMSAKETSKPTGRVLSPTPIPDQGKIRVRPGWVSFCRWNFMAETPNSNAPMETPALVANFQSVTPRGVWEPLPATLRSGAETRPFSALCTLGSAAPIPATLGSKPRVFRRRPSAVMVRPAMSIRPSPCMPLARWNTVIAEIVLGPTRPSTARRRLGPASLAGT